MVILMSGVKIKLEVETHDEIYYPVVSVVKNNLADMPERIEITKSPEVAEVIEVKSGGLHYNDTNEAMSGENEPAMVTVIENSVEPRRERGGLRKWGSRFGTAMVAVVAMIAVVLVGLRLAGFRTFTVMSGSMTPEYPVGSLIYVKPVDYHELKVGDVISYVANDDKTVVTHRIAEIEVDANDSSVWRFRTKGDANTTADAKLVHYKNVLGTPIIVLPFIGYFAHNIQEPPGIYIALVVGTLLLAWTFLPGTLEERRKTARKSVA